LQGAAQHIYPVIKQDAYMLQSDVRQHSQSIARILCGYFPLPGTGVTQNREWFIPVKGLHEKVQQVTPGIFHVFQLQPLCPVVQQLLADVLPIHCVAEWGHSDHGPRLSCAFIVP
jgi:hypothetical protein